MRAYRLAFRLAVVTALASLILFAAGPGHAAALPCIRVAGQTIICV